MAATQLEASGVLALPARVADRLLLALARARDRQLLNADAVACQERLIGVLVSRSASTEFGRRHGFSRIGSAAEFLHNVPPQTYGGLKTRIDAILAGQPDVLFPGRPSCFAATSGTLGAPKLIPLNRALLRGARLSALDAALRGSLAAGTMAWRRGKMLYVGPRRGRLMSSQMMYREGAAQAYLVPRLLRRMFIPVYEELPEYDSQHDFQALADLAADHKVTAVAGSPPEIVAFVQSTGIVLERVRLVFNCGHFASDSLSAYSSAFPNAALVDVYGANEGTYGLPYLPGCFLMNVSRIFFSFLPLAGGAEAVGIREAEPGTKYRLCVTTPAGLWNYVTDDVVVLVSLAPPLLKLCGRADRVLSIAGEAVTEDEVIAATRSAGLTTDRYFMTAASRRYVLYADGQGGDPVTVDAELRQLNRAYDTLRREGALQPVAVCQGEVADLAPRKPVRIVPDEGQAQALLGRCGGRPEPILDMDQQLTAAPSAPSRERA